MENFVDFNALYGLAGDEMERIDNEALQGELAKVQQAQQGVADTINPNAIGSIDNIDYQNTNLASIEQQNAGGWNAAQNTMQYGDFMKAQQGLEKKALDISKKTGGMYGSLRQGYGDDTLAAKLMSGDEEGMNAIFGNDENFNDEIARNQGKQNQLAENKKAARTAYVDRYNKALQDEANRNANNYYSMYMQSVDGYGNSQGGEDTLRHSKDAMEAYKKYMESIGQYSDPNSDDLGSIFSDARVSKIKGIHSTTPNYSYNQKLKKTY